MLLRAAPARTASFPAALSSRRNQPGLPSASAPCHSAHRPPVTKISLSVSRLLQKYLFRYAKSDNVNDYWQLPSDTSPAVLRRFWVSALASCVQDSATYPANWVFEPHQSYIDWGILSAALCEKDDLLAEFGAFHPDVYASELAARADFSLWGQFTPKRLSATNAVLTSDPVGISTPFTPRHHVYSDTELQELVDELMSGQSPV
ncbi:hypothetical protein AURDEDRAFT_120827 [Auricularia subglabra TFB-10046 SS5]|nr:hypothetical protein AURDEDRAFT_120827 [Auricularia subglabra TFB-10046 SS5]